MTKRILAIAAAAAMLVGTSWAADTLSAQDYFEIQQLYARYNIAIDSGDAEGWAATFTPDGVFNTFSGHEALVWVHKDMARKTGTARHGSTGTTICRLPETPRRPAHPRI